MNPEEPSLDRGLVAITATKRLMARKRAMLKKRRNLWTEAAALLSKEDYVCLDFDGETDKGQPIKILGDIETQVNKLQQKQWRIHKRNGQDVTVRELFEKVVTWVNKFKEFGDMVVQLEPVHAGLPWAAMRFFLQLAMSDVERYGAMLEGVEVVAGIVARYAEVEKSELYGRSSLKTQLENALVRLYVVVLEYMAQAKRYYSASTGKRVAKALIANVGSIGDGLGRVEKEEATVYNLVLLVQAENQTNRLSSIRTSLRTLEQRVVETSSATLMARRQLLGRLSATYTDDNYDGSLSLRQSGTATWVFDRDIFKEWTAPSSSSKLLWIHGPPGFGKTVLAASVVERMQKERPQSTAYFFCVSENEAKREPVSILTSFLAQLIERNDGAVARVKEIVGLNDERPITRTEKWILLRIICEEVRGCTFIIDGFDECTSTNRISRFQTDDARALFMRELLTEVGKTKADVLLISRDTAEIRTEVLREGLSDMVVTQYAITEQDTRPDVQKLSKHMVDFKLSKKPENIRAQLVEKATDKAEGMFLWVHLLSQKLKPGANAKRLDAVVSEMPAGLEQAYDRDLRHINSLDDYERERAISILRWVLFAERPLTVRELAEALILSGDIEDDCYPVDELPDSWSTSYVDEEYVNDVLRQPLGSLITLKRRSEDEPLSCHTVHFVHYSVKEYLLRANQSGVCFADIKLENNLLARLCLQYLCFETFTNQETSWARKDRDRPFLVYTSCAWFRHAQTEGYISGSIVDCVCRLLNEKTTNWIVWSNTYISRISEFYDIPSVDDKMIEQAEHTVYSIKPDGSPMYWACHLGLLDVVKRLHSDRLDLNVTGGVYNTPIKAAIREGHLKTVEYLIKSGVDVVTEAGDAAWAGNIEILNLLLDSGADIELKDQDGSRPVFYATYHPPLLKVCIERGADIATPDNVGSTPLHFAASYGRLESVKLLLEGQASSTGGATVDPESAALVTPLMKVTYSSSTATLDFLLQHGADLHHCAINGDSILDLAMQAYDKTFLLHLFKRGILGRTNAAAWGQDSHTNLDIKLYNAILDDDIKSVRNTLQDIPDLNWPALLDSALHVAALKGSVEISRLLLSRGSSATPLMSNKRTPLHHAARHGYLEVVRVLLNSGVDFYTLDIRHQLPLHVALQWGWGSTQVEILSYFLDRYRTGLGYYAPSESLLDAWEERSTKAPRSSHWAKLHDTPELGSRFYIKSWTVEEEDNGRDTYFAEPPRFTGYGWDGEIQYDIYGILYGDAGVMWMMVYSDAEQGRLCNGQIDGYTLTITGAWGKKSSLHQVGTTWIYVQGEERWVPLSAPGGVV